jgi:hypothetical protein
VRKRKSLGVGNTNSRIPQHRWKKRKTYRKRKAYQ